MTRPWLRLAARSLSMMFLMKFLGRAGWLGDAEVAQLKAMEPLPNEEGIRRRA